MTANETQDSDRNARLVGSDSLFATASFYLTVAAAAAKHQGHRKLAGALMLLVGYGYAGVVWERMGGARIRRDLDVGRLDRTQLLSHSVAAIVGYRWLTRR